MVPGLELLAAIVGSLLVVHLLIHRRLPAPPKSGRDWGCVLLAAVTLIFLACIAIGPIGPSIGKARESAAMQTCRTIALAEFQYANDNDGRYPTGNSSTEVFQKLIDGNYISDPAVFFIPMQGKTEATSKRLLPENVCYDVTADVGPDSPDGLPVAFLTGFRIEYKAGGRAISLVKPFPRYFEGLAVAYKSNNAWFRMSRVPGTGSPQISADGFGVVPDVLASDFNGAGKVYRQLTPTGVLR